MKRFEYKYLLTIDQYAQLKQIIVCLMQTDSFCFNTHDAYLVDSVYYDTPSYNDYYDVIDGLLIRKKIRIRNYVNSGGSYYEEKMKFNQEVSKIRIKQDDNQSDDFYQLYKNLYNRIPVVNIKYLREAFISPELSLRITFDKYITAKSVLINRSPEYEILPNKVILECKHPGLVPKWLQNLIVQFNLTKDSISKYCLGMQACGIV